MPLNKKHLFVSVGTTKFDELITKVTSKECLNLILSIGFQSITFQTGSGRKISSNLNSYGLVIKQKAFFDQFCEEVRKADLVICHAGAGTCIEVMRSQVPLIIVINESLMENHQIELAEALQKENFLIHCTVNTFLNTLATMQNLQMTKFPIAKEHPFCNYVDQVMGF